MRPYHRITKIGGPGPRARAITPFISSGGQLSLCARWLTFYRANSFVSGGPHKRRPTAHHNHHRPDTTSETIVLSISVRSLSGTVVRSAGGA